MFWKIYTNIYIYIYIIIIIVIIIILLLLYYYIIILLYYIIYCGSQFSGGDPWAHNSVMSRTKVTRFVGEVLPTFHEPGLIPTWYSFGAMYFLQFPNSKSYRWLYIGYCLWFEVECRCIHLAGYTCTDMYISTFISGWWFQPLWKILVSWDCYSQYMEKYKMLQTTKQISMTRMTSIAVGFMAPLTPHRKPHNSRLANAGHSPRDVGKDLVTDSSLKVTRARSYESYILVRKTLMFRFRGT